VFVAGCWVPCIDELFELLYSADSLSDGMFYIDDCTLLLFFNN
jgi:hypothetical protein